MPGTRCASGGSPCAPTASGPASLLNVPCEYLPVLIAPSCFARVLGSELCTASAGRRWPPGEDLGMAEPAAGPRWRPPLGGPPSGVRLPGALPIPDRIGVTESFKATLFVGAGKFPVAELCPGGGCNAARVPLPRVPLFPPEPGRREEEKVAVERVRTTSETCPRQGCPVAASPSGVCQEGCPRNRRWTRQD